MTLQRNVLNEEGTAIRTINQDTRKAKLVSAGSSFTISDVDGAELLELRVVNGGTAQYIQVWDANDVGDIAGNGILLECIYLEPNNSGYIAAIDPEASERGLVMAASSTALTYSAGANIAFAKAEYILD